jgi:CheY-specific phosphatase CheX
MESCAAVVEESLNAITVKDLMELIGSKAHIKGEFKNLYVKNLLSQVSQEEFDKLPEDKKKAITEVQNLYKVLIEGYKTYLTSKSVSEALAENAKQIPKSLEKILAA